MDIFPAGNAVSASALRRSLPDVSDAVLILYLDRYHLGDPFFLPAFARDVKAHAEGLVIVHGSGEAGERALEAEGLLPEWRGGVLVVGSDHERALVERAARDLNRRVVHELNEAGVSALRMLGADRGLLREGVNGGLDAGRVGWLDALVRQGAVPVVATLVAGMEGGPLVEADPAAAAVALVRAFEGEEPPTVAFLTTNRRAGLFAGAERLPAIAVSVLPADGTLPEPDAIRRAAAEGVRVKLITSAALRGAGVPEGTEVLLD